MHSSKRRAVCSKPGLFPNTCRWVGSSVVRTVHWLQQLVLRLPSRGKDGRSGSVLDAEYTGSQRCTLLIPALCHASASQRASLQALPLLCALCDGGKDSCCCSLLAMPACFKSPVPACRVLLLQNCLVLIRTGCTGNHRRQSTLARRPGGCSPEIHNSTACAAHLANGLGVWMRALATEDKLVTCKGGGLRGWLHVSPCVRR